MSEKEDKRRIGWLDWSADRVVKQKPRDRNEEEWLYILRRAAEKQAAIAREKRDYGYQKKRKAKKCEKPE